MEDISNKTLAMMLVAAVMISLGGTMVSLNKLGNYVQKTPVLPVGMAQTETGSTSVTVTQSVSIILQNPPGSNVDFGTGHVNVSSPTCNAQANMVAMSNSSAQYVDVNNCWIEEIGGSPQGWIIENNGNINASVTVRGPTEASFFRGYSGAYATILRWRINLSDTGCARGRNESWTRFSDNTTACSNLPWDESIGDDDMGVDVNLTIPRDLGAGTYSNSSIEFYAVQGS